MAFTLLTDALMALDISSLKPENVIFGDAVLLNEASWKISVIVGDGSSSRVKPH